ncbi:MAG: glycosyltransferase family 4 protein [Candidatus Omnitrophica bacterium]|nr:glycosyltransferase family 4 protein [Candidatus Omnitrophota bacterium]MDD5545952.1 glycosyltransferase family 4 protein [Candidatus Omnitrophota bacterium]
MTPKKLKVLRIIARLNVGGPAIHTILLTQALNDEYYRSILVTGRVGIDEKDMGYLARGKGVEPLIIPELGRRIDPVNDLIALWKMYLIMRRERPDIVHTHTAKAGALGRAAAILAGIPVRIHTFHGHIFESYFNSFSAGVFLFIERSLAFFSKYIVVVSETQKKEIIKKYKITGDEKVKVVPLGLELDVLSSIGSREGKLRNELGIGNDCVLIGIIGRLVPVKNHRMFLDACKKLFDKAGGRDIKCIVIGDGEERAGLEGYAEKSGIREKIVFHGWKEEMADVYADLDIIALTSFNEGTPVALIEALAAGRPVVSTDVGGVKDVVDDGINGCLVASGDAAGFAKRLLELAVDPEKRDEFGRNGRRKVLQKYSKERLVKDMKALYEEALRQRD